MVVRHVQWALGGACSDPARAAAAGRAFAPSHPLSLPMPPRKLAERKRSERAAVAVSFRRRRPVKYPRAPRGRKPSRIPRPAPVWAPALFDDTGLPCSSCGHPFGRRGGMFRARGEPPCPWDVCLRCLQPMMAATQLLAGARPGVRAAAQRGSGRNVERRAALF